MEHLKIFASVIEPEAIAQVYDIAYCEAYKDSVIRIMPDVHKGASSPIGFTCTVVDKIIPATVGVDIGCGMLIIPLGNIILDLKKLDKIIKDNLPNGLGVYHKKQKAKFDELSNLHCYKYIKHKECDILNAIGTLGHGNHFIEIDKDDDNNYLVIHSGSRNIGKLVCDHYQDLANKYCNVNRNNVNDIINDLKSKGKLNEIEKTIKEFKQNIKKISKNYCYLEFELKDRYLHDMQIIQNYASLNRLTIAKIILEKYFNNAQVNLSSSFKLKIKSKEFKYSGEGFETIHNYISIEDNIIRKGAIAAYKNHPLLIPINMRDGCIYGYGKSNPDMNFSSCHGAGRLMSRSKAKETINFNEYQKSMEGIYSSTVTQGTIDEAPMAYKSIQTIIDNIQDSVDIIKIIKPIYNFKSDVDDVHNWK